MQTNFIDYIEPISLYVLFTFTNALLFLNVKSVKNRLLFAILTVCFFTELATYILVINKKSIDLAYSISMFFHGGLWLLYITRQFMKINVLSIVMIVFTIFGVVNLFFIEGLENCNFNTFIIGALSYIILFIYQSFRNLKKEKFSFFLSNNYLLLFTPILFFFGLSFMFGFKSDDLAETIIFGKIELYDFIGYFVNIIYYTLINIYIYREKRLQYVG